jgi:hypothetical protein
MPPPIVLVVVASLLAIRRVARFFFAAFFKAFRTPDVRSCPFALTSTRSLLARMTASACCGGSGRAARPSPRLGRLASRCAGNRHRSLPQVFQSRAWTGSGRRGSRSSYANLAAEKYLPRPTATRM